MYLLEKSVLSVHRNGIPNWSQNMCPVWEYNPGIAEDSISMFLMKYRDLLLTMRQDCPAADLGFIQPWHSGHSAKISDGPSRVDIAALDQRLPISVHAADLNCCGQCFILQSCNCPSGNMLLFKSKSKQWCLPCCSQRKRNHMQGYSIVFRSRNTDLFKRKSATNNVCRILMH